MRYLLILLSFLTLSASAQNMSGASQVIRIWDNNSAPHSNGLAVAGEVKNNRPALTTETVLFVYTPKSGRHNGRGVVICPGGGYRHLSMENEGAYMAEWFAAHGYVAAVLQYRMPNAHPEVPLEDATEAIRLLRGKSQGVAKEWQVEKVGIVGSSAGGHLAAMTSTMSSERPDFSLLFYPTTCWAQTARRPRAHTIRSKIALQRQRRPPSSSLPTMIAQCPRSTARSTTWPSRSRVLQPRCTSTPMVVTASVCATRSTTSTRGCR